MTHPSFIDMLDVPVEGFEILRQVESIDGEARWRCRHLACGAEVTLLGSQLRGTSRGNHKPPKFCEACMPPHLRGKVKRRYHVCGCSPSKPCPIARGFFSNGQTRDLEGHLRRTMGEDA